MPSTTNSSTPTTNTSSTLNNEGSDRERAAGRIHRLHLENFKSYIGRHTLGPFTHQFTSIIGPNGSGKSNVMDALSFVLGVSSSSSNGRNRRSTGDGGAMRAAESMRELVARGEDGEPVAPYAKVSIEYEMGGGEGMKLFSRKITLSPSSAATRSEYSINNKTLKWEQYAQEWQQEGILVKARNFLVFQGDVEALATKTPHELTQFIEHISGSQQYRQEYEECKAALDATVREHSLLFGGGGKRRGVGLELRMIQEQRDDYDEWTRLQGQLARLQTQQALWKLFHLETDAKSAGKETESLQSQLLKLEQKMAAKQKLLDRQREDYEHTLKDTHAARQAAKQAQRALDALAPTWAQSKQASDLATATLTTLATTTKQEQEREQERLSQNLQACTQQISEQRDAIREHEQQAAQQQSSNPSLYSPAKLQEYDEIALQVHAVTGTQRLRLEECEQSLHPLLRERERLQARLAELDMDAHNLTRLIHTVTSQQHTLSQEIGAEEDQVQTHTLSLNKLQCKGKWVAEKREELRSQLATCLNTLLSLKVDSGMLKREEAKRRLQQALKREFPSRVHGTLSSLITCKRKNKVYQVAIDVALGRHKDAIVVDGRETAIACIAFIKQQQQQSSDGEGLANCTLLPLDTLQSSNSAATAAAIKRSEGGGDFKMASECINFDEMYAAAIDYALGNVIVCNGGVKEARALQSTLNLGARYKFVSVDGVLLRANGVITGGHHPSNNANIGSEGNQQHMITKLSAQRDALLQELDALNGSASSSMGDEGENSSTPFNTRLQHIQSAISTHQQRAKQLTLQKDALGRTIADKQSLLASLQTEINHLRPQLASNPPHLQALLEQHREAQAEIDREKALHFAKFLEATPFATIHEWEAARREGEEGRNLQQTALHCTLSKLEHHRDFIVQQLEGVEAALKRTRDAIAHQEAQVSALSHTLSTLKDKQSEARRRLQLAKQELEQMQAKEETTKTLLDKSRTELDAVHRQLRECSQSLVDAECAIERCLAERRGIVYACSIDQVDLPKHAGSGDGDEDEDMSGDGGAYAHFDYSLLTSEQRRRNDLALHHHLQEQIDECNKACSQLQSKLRSLEALDAQQARLQQSLREQNENSQKLQACKQAFSAIKHKRQSAFLATFTPLSKHINSIYTQLTSSALMPTGGTAFISLDNQDEPWLAGTRYHAMPPMKRFLDMNLLSGGEKSVAALALLFAVGVCGGVPFMVLDEVDAALDAGNTSRLARWIREQTSTDHAPTTTSPLLNTQFIVISLKSSMYSQADALIGIYKDRDRESSASLSLSLCEYDAYE